MGKRVKRVQINFESFEEKYEEFLERVEVVLSAELRGEGRLVSVREREDHEGDVISVVEYIEKELP